MNLIYRINEALNEELNKNRNPNDMQTTIQLKQFFKSKYDLTVRINSSGNKPHSYVTVRLQDLERDPRKPPRYESEFPLALRVLCLDIIYPTHKGSDMNTRGNAGNVRSHSIAMVRTQWVELLNQLNRTES